jgi:hypothetical protein
MKKQTDWHNANAPTHQEQKRTTPSPHKIGLLRADWKENLLGNLKKCQKICIQVMTKTGLIDWFHHKDRATMV